jgi:hypothetical protein
MVEKGGTKQAEPASRCRVWQSVSEISKMVENYTMKIRSRPSKNKNMAVTIESITPSLCLDCTND